ncbi:hypothetical protein Salat_0854200 [Sesamum alatum]|uniref:Uncharacterized protein n=1 Tax=Sesamum alatum TaxID=300844 RepID=A0AAE2CQM7_9LAMI|nr:hypothetical protein Salat_0854200 [Sesamum alatum]
MEDRMTQQQIQGEVGIMSYLVTWSKRETTGWAASPEGWVQSTHSGPPTISSLPVTAHLDPTPIFTSIHEATSVTKSALLGQPSQPRCKPPNGGRATESTAGTFPHPDAGRQVNHKRGSTQLKCSGLSFRTWACWEGIRGLS